MRSADAAGHFPGWAEPTVPGHGPKPDNHFVPSFQFFYFFKIPKICINFS
jgi:hypothetical protein